MSGDLDARLLRLDGQVYGVPVTITRPDGAVASLRGVFDRRHLEVLGAEGPAQATLRVTLGIRLADCPWVRVGDVVNHAGTRWMVAECRPDAAGGVELVLSARQDGAA